MFARTILLVAGASAAILGSETKIQMKDLPEQVRKTVQELTKTSTLRGLVKEVKNGATFYEAETTLNGKSRDVLIDKTGAVVEVEEATILASIPEAARESLKAAAGTGKILKVESVTKGSVVSYEAVIQKGGVKSEVAVNADGSRKKD